MTGHLKSGSLDLDWRALVRPRQTLVIYLGLAALPALARELVAHGLDAATPAAMVEQGTTKEQRVVAGALNELPRLAAETGMAPPALTIVGEVVRLRQRLQRFDPAAPSSAIAEVA